MEEDVVVDEVTTERGGPQHFFGFGEAEYLPEPTPPYTTASNTPALSQVGDPDPDLFAQLYIYG